MISSQWRTTFHVTHERSLPGIRRFGLDPTLSRRPAKRVWLCDFDKLPWAINHVCTTQGWFTGEIKVLRVTLPRDSLVRHREGIWYVTWRIHPGCVGASLACQY